MTPIDDTRVDVAVVGGGLGGLALAVGLRAKGFDAHVFESAPELRTATSTMIGLGRNAWRALGDLHPELPTKLKARGALVETRRFTMTPPDRPSKLTVMPDQAVNDMYTIRWSEVQVALAELLPPDAIHCGHAATGYTEMVADGAANGLNGGPETAIANGTSNGGVGTALVHFRDQPDVRAALVVGADGINSAIRATMHPDDPGPRYLGHMNWNAIIHNPNGATVKVHEPGDLVALSDGISGEVDMHHQMYVINAGGGYTFWQVRKEYLEPTYTAGATRAAMGTPGCKARVLNILQDLGWAGAGAAVVEATPEAVIYERPILDLLPLERWSSPGRRVVLLGDAAHAMHPGPGQGARTAFEDAHQLVAALVRYAPDIPSAVRAYEAVRVPRAARFQLYASENCGVAAIRQAARPAGLSAQEYVERSREFFNWIESFPDNQLGDPDSRWWKPE